MTQIIPHWLRAIGLGCLLCLGCTSEAPEAKHPSLEEKALEADRLFELGNAFAEQGNAVRAEQYLSLALERGSPREKVLPRLLEVCLDAGRLRTALHYAEPALRDDPADYRLRTLAATILSALGEASTALGELQRVLRNAPDYAPARYLAGTLLWEAFDDEAGAREQFTAYLKLEPHGHHAPEVVAWFHEREWMKERAKQDETGGRG